MEKLLTTARNHKLEASLALGTIVLGFGVSGCGAAGVTQQENTTIVSHNKNAADEAQNSQLDGPSVTYVYHDNGTLEVILGDRGFNHDLASVNTLFEFCQGNDLVTIVENNTPFKWSGGGLDRSPNDPACADGKLTPTDF